MSSVAFDTHQAVKNIREAGANEHLAEAIVRELTRTADLPDISNLATKGDLIALGSELKGDIAALKSELKGDNTALGNELKGTIAAVDAKVTMLMWMIGVLGVGSIAVQILHIVHAF